MGAIMCYKFELKSLMRWVCVWFILRTYNESQVCDWTSLLVRFMNVYDQNWSLDDHNFLVEISFWVDRRKFLDLVRNTLILSSSLHLYPLTYQWIKKKWKLIKTYPYFLSQKRHHYANLTTIIYYIITLNYI